MVSVAKAFLKRSSYGGPPGYLCKACHLWLLPALNADRALFLQTARFHASLPHPAVESPEPREEE